MISIFEINFFTINYFRLKKLVGNDIMKRFLHRLVFLPFCKPPNSNHPNRIQIPRRLRKIIRLNSGNKLHLTVLNLLSILFCHV